MIPEDIKSNKYGERTEVFCHRCGDYSSLKYLGDVVLCKPCIKRTKKETHGRKNPGIPKDRNEMK